MIAFLVALPLGLLLGIAFGPFRLAGVDYSQWYRDPGEVSELNDRSWIGLVKTAGLVTGRRTVGLVLLVFILGKIVAGHSIPIHTPLATGTHWHELLGLIGGAVLTQAVVEGAWRLGLLAIGQPTSIHLARTPGAAVTFASRTPTQRRLVVCCDGTWNSPNQTRETNVVQLTRVIKPLTSTGVTQITYYHQGVGTGNIVDRFLGGGAGIGLSGSVKAAYGFLVDNFQDGDEILLFGFSRGAYVVRSLAGLIEMVGLLEKQEMFRFPQVWSYYSRPKAQRSAAALAQIAPKRRLAVISCVGVWDTVGALGLPGTKLCSSTYAFHHTALGSCVRHAFQALAMDERRGNFQPAVWVRSDLGQTLEQVWFPGVHSDVGGGYVEHGLADTTLRWMLGKLEQYQLLEIDINRLSIAVNRADAEAYDLGKLHDSRSRFWKLIAGPVPRPVGITDSATEQVHPSAWTRANAPPARRDPYASSRRRAWLASLPAGAKALRPALENNRVACGVPPGIPDPVATPAKRSLCSWVIDRIFGGA